MSQGASSDVPAGDRPPRTRLQVGVSLAAAPSLTGEVEGVLGALASSLHALHPGVGWEVRRVSHEAPSLPAAATVQDLLAYGRSRLLEDNFDVVLVLSDREATLHGRPVEAHVSPVQQSALLRVRSGSVAGTATQAALLVSAVVGLDESREDEQKLLGQLAEDGPAEPNPARFASHTIRRNAALLFVLVRGNRPWRLALHLSRTLTGAFAASFLAVVTPDFWLLADRMSAPRLCLITAAVLAVLCAVLVIGGNLREHAPNRSARRAVVLHNAAVWLSVAIGVGTLYLGLLGANYLVTVIVLPHRLLEETLGHAVSAGTLVRVGALTGAVALVGSVFGAGLEDDEDVHTATFTGSDDVQYAGDDPAS